VVRRVTKASAVILNAEEWDFLDRRARRRSYARKLVTARIGKAAYRGVA
jgi:ribosomal protein L20